MAKCETNKKGDVENTWYHTFSNKSPMKWLEEKRQADDTNGLWRVHDNLYDVTSFIDKHPGGRFWLEATKGMDITEAFESHHIKSDVPEEMLKKFFVKKAEKPRVSKYTFQENGFYKTVKRRVRDVLKTLPKDLHKVSDMYTDSLLLGTFVFACLANALSMYTFAILASVCCSFLIIATHNYSHQRDNFRMLYGHFFMMSSRDFRIIHVLSHHAFSNSRIDLQLTFTLPMINVFPEKKSFIVKYMAWVTATLVVFPFMIHAVGLSNIYESLTQKMNYKNVFMPLVLPVVMYYVGGHTLLSTIAMWQIILLVTGIFVATISYTTTHVHPDLYVEGDAMRPQEELDWGIGQLDTIYDRKEIIGNDFFTLVTFGDHAIHHLFPTLDHSYLKHLYPVVEETLKEFNIKSINVTTTADLYLGFFRQAAREKPSSKPSYLEKVC